MTGSLASKENKVQHLQDSLAQSETELKKMETKMKLTETTGNKLCTRQVREMEERLEQAQLEMEQNLEAFAIRIDFQQKQLIKCKQEIQKMKTKIIQKDQAMKLQEEKLIS